MVIGGTGHKPPQPSQDDLLDATGCITTIIRRHCPLLLIKITQLLLRANTRTVIVASMMFSSETCLIFVYPTMHWLVENAESHMGIVYVSLRKSYTESVTAKQPS